MLLTNRDAGAYFSEGAWEEWQAPSGHGSGVRGKKTPLSSIKMHLILDRVDYILYDVKHVQKCGGGGYSPALEYNSIDVPVIACKRSKARNRRYISNESIELNKSLKCINIAKLRQRSNVSCFSNISSQFSGLE